jgi:hypothetical protein
MPGSGKYLKKAVFKEAVSEWLHEQFATLGKRTHGGILSAGFAAPV